MTSDGHERRVLGFSFNSRGFGFALLEGGDRLVDYGVKVVRPWCERSLRRKLWRLILQAAPDALAIGIGIPNPDTRASESVRVLFNLAEPAHMRIIMVRIDRVRKALQGQTQFEVAEAVVDRFPELQVAPPKQRESQHSRTAVFMSIAIALAAQEGDSRQSRRERN